MGTRVAACTCVPGCVHMCLQARTRVAGLHEDTRREESWARCVLTGTRGAAGWTPGLGQEGLHRVPPGRLGSPPPASPSPQASAGQRQGSCCPQCWAPVWPPVTPFRERSASPGGPSPPQTQATWPLIPAWVTAAFVTCRPSRAPGDSDDSCPSLLGSRVGETGQTCCQKVPPGVRPPARRTAPAPQQGLPEPEGWPQGGGERALQCLSGVTG